MSLDGCVICRLLDVLIAERDAALELQDWPLFVKSGRLASELIPSNKQRPQ